MSASAVRPRAIVAHGIWGRGGAEAAAMWILAALAEDFEVTVHTRGGFDLAALNDLAGTRLPPGALTLRMAGVEGPLPIGALAAGRFLRSLRDAGSGFDLCVSASGILPWGRPALHVLSSVDCDPRIAADHWQRGRPSMKARLSGLIQRVAAGGPPVGGTGLFVANSEWLAGICAPACSGPVEVIHPAVVAPPPGAPWDARDDAVLVFGRLAPEKRVETCIRIVERARASGFGGGLLIAGPEGTADYAARIRALAQGRDWITLLPSQTGTDRDALLGRVRYGLNACANEAFGISTAEMAAAGAIVLVPQGTGQGEIVPDPFQHYRSEEEAAAKLVALGRDGALQRRLHADALARRDRFGPDRFVTELRRAAQRALSLTRPGGAD
jgi:glycosyltransferase involved in cell wall biosynthesis